MRIQSLFILASLILVLAACAQPTAAPSTLESFSPSPTTTTTSETEETITPVDIISTPTPVIEASATPVPTETMTPTASQTPTPDATATEAYTPTTETTPTKEATLTKTSKPTITPIPTNTKVPTWTQKPPSTSTPANTIVPTWTQKPTTIPKPTDTKVPTKTARPTNTKPPTRTPKPTATETAKPTPFIYPDLVLNKTTEYPGFAQLFSEEKRSISENKIPVETYYLGDNPNTSKIEPPRVGWTYTNKETLSANISKEDYQMCKEKAEYILKEGWDDTTLWNRSPFSAWHFHRYTDKSKTPWKVTLCEWEDAGIDTKLKKHIFDFDKESIPNIYP